MNNDRFKRGSGCFKCEACGKMTRDIGQGKYYCKACQERLEHENVHADHDFVNDDCGMKDCPVRDYPIEKKWWLKNKTVKEESK